MEAAQIGELISQFGVGATALVLFIVFFLDKYKKQDKQLETRMDEIKEQFEKRETQLHDDIVRREEQYKERERILVAESARREEILKQESEKRESIIRDESLKREASLLTTIDSFTRTMKEISTSMNIMKNTTNQVQYKLENIEKMLNKEGADGNG